MNLRLPNLSQLYSFVCKFGGAGLAGYGVNTHNLSTMTVGAAVAAFVHLVDSVFNSSPGQHPTV